MRVRTRSVMSFSTASETYLLTYSYIHTYLHTDLLPYPLGHELFNGLRDVIDLARLHVADERHLDEHLEELVPVGC